MKKLINNSVFDTIVVTCSDHELDHLLRIEYDKFSKDFFIDMAVKNPSFWDRVCLGFKYIFKNEILDGINIDKVEMLELIENLSVLVDDDN